MDEWMNKLSRLYSVTGHEEMGKEDVESGVLIMSTKTIIV